MINIGYACDNLTLKDTTTSRTCRKATWTNRGLDIISECAVKNVLDLKTIIEWNIDNGYKLFRMSSDLIPWFDFYSFDKLKHSDTIRMVLEDIGETATDNDLRLTFHPGPFCVLASPNLETVDRTIRELEYHSMIFDMMGFTPSHYNKINIHIGGAYGDKRVALDRWIENWKRLDDNTKKRLVIENDDKPSMYTVQDLMYVHEQIGIPITFDYYHHSLNPGDLTEQQALEMAISTWPDDVRPCTHYSECRRDEQQRAIREMMEAQNINYADIDEWPTFKKFQDEFNKTKITAHSDYVENEINDYGHDIDCVVEAKAKNLATDRYRKMYQSELILG